MLPQIFPVRFQDYLDLEGEDDDILTLFNSSEQKLLQSLLANASNNPDLYFSDYEEMDADYIDEKCAELMLKLMSTSMLVPVQRHNLPLESYEANTGSWAYASAPTEWRAGVWALAAAINNSVTWSYIALRKGSYVVRVGCRTGAGFGVGWLKFDGVTHETIDFYSAGALTNQRKTSPSFDIADDGVYDFSIVMASKHASSTNYALQLNWIDIIRIGD